MKTVRVLLPIILAVAMAGPAAAASPSPAAAPGDWVLSRALMGLDALDSFRVTSTTVSALTGEEPMVEVTTMRRAPGFALRYQVLDDGEVALDEIVVGDQGWKQSFGGTWRNMGAEMDPVPTEASWPVVPRLLRSLDEAGIELALVGDETIDGRATQHYRGELAPPVRPSDPRMMPNPSIAGTLDLWVDATAGVLVRAEADVLDFDGEALALGVGSLRTQARIDITAVDDPSVVITPPDLTPTALASPGGDPALADTVRQAFARLREHRTYRATIETHAGGYADGADLWVVGGPAPRIHAVLDRGGLPALELLASGDQVWQRSGGDDQWTSADGSVSCGEEPCSVQAFTRFDGGLDGLFDTFTLVPDDSRLVGTPAVHLRSVAGHRSDRAGPTPGVTDLWIAKDDGRLLQLLFDGQGIRTRVTITQVDDPTIAVDLPGPDELAPSPSPLVITIDEPTESPPA